MLEWLSQISPDSVGYVFLSAVIGIIGTVAVQYWKNRGQIDVAKINAQSAEKIHEQGIVVDMLKILQNEVSELRVKQREHEQTERALLDDITNLVDHLALIITSRSDDDRELAVNRAEAYLTSTGRNVRT